MNYQISEDEFNRLSNVGHQIGLMSDLACAIVGKREVEIDVSNLLAFMMALEEQLRAVLKTVDERYEAQRAINQGEGALSWIDWAHALYIANGDEFMAPIGAAETITRKLAAAATVDPGWRGGEDVWRLVLARQHAKSAVELTSSAKTQSAGNAKSRQRKRERLSA